MKKMVQQQEEIRKGPWTEQEDAQLGFYVNMFGDRRWDFVAKVSGLKRTGKSCRLRWVNYLHPGLKHGKMTPHEERLVLELHSKWGNRWSRIARKLPGRTDNEIKNYWRTHMRKKAQLDRKKNNLSNSSSSTSLSHSNSSTSFSKGNNTPPAIPVAETKERNFYDTGGVNIPATSSEQNSMNNNNNNRIYTLDDIWKDMDLAEDNNNYYVNKPILDGFMCEGESYFSGGQTIAPSPVWNVSLWTTTAEEEEERKMFPPKNNSIISDHQFYSFY